MCVFLFHNYSAVPLSRAYCASRRLGVKRTKFINTSGPLHLLALIAAGFLGGGVTHFPAYPLNCRTRSRGRNKQQSAKQTHTHTRCTLNSINDCCCCRSCCGCCCCCWGVVITRSVVVIKRLGTCYAPRAAACLKFIDTRLYVHMYL